jgi:hypothetical protein
VLSVWPESVALVLDLRDPTGCLLPSAVAQISIRVSAAGWAAALPPPPRPQMTVPPAAAGRAAAPPPQRLCAWPLGCGGPAEAAVEQAPVHHVPSHADAAAPSGCCCCPLAVTARTSPPHPAAAVGPRP